MTQNVIKDAIEAENIAIRFILSRFHRSKIRVHRVSHKELHDKELWSVEGEVKIGLFRRKKESFKVEVSSNADIIAYEFTEGEDSKVFREGMRPSA